jgi:hypothetical protein
MVRECQAAIKLLEAEASKSEPGEPATVHG